MRLYIFYLNLPIRSITRVKYHQLTWCNSYEDDCLTGCRHISHCQHNLGLRLRSGGKQARKKRLSGPLGSLRSRTFFGCFLATEPGPRPMSTTVKDYAHPDDHNEMTPGFKIFSVPSFISPVYSEAPLIFNRLTFTVLVFSFVKHAPDKNQTPSSDEGK